LWRFPALERVAGAEGAAGQGARVAAAGAGPEGDETGREDGATGGEVIRAPAAAAADGAVDGPPGLPSAAAVERMAAELARLGEEAEARRRRPFSAAASEEAHQRLRELAAAGDEETEEGAAEDGGSRRRAAMAAGAAVHRALELLDLAADEPGGEAEAAGDRLAGYLAAVLPTAAPEWKGALERAAALWRRFAAGPLHDRLSALDGRVIARELPVLLPAPAEVRETGAPPPVGFVSGSIDLLYLDEDDRPVVADYKTDAVAGDDELAARAAAYAPQGEVYARAVAEALGLADLPRFELWFLDAGRVVEVSGEPGAPGRAEAIGRDHPDGAAVGPAGDSELNTVSSRPTQLPLFDDEETPR
jgi:ATP-dependent exoDNAse (exonuclease V) beta subunit